MQTEPVMSQAEFEQQPALSQALIITEQADQLVKEAMQDPVHGLLRIRIESLFTQIKNILAFHSGQTVNTILTSSAELHPPITDFFGEKISGPKKVEEADLNPDEAEKDQYVARVNSLAIQLPGLDPYSAIDDYSRPEDQLIRRGVAKLANVEGYEDREINVQYIEDILAGQKQIALDQAEDARINQEMMNREKAQEAQGKLDIATTKREALIKDRDEALSNLEAATTDKQKEGRKKKLDGIQTEIAAADDYIAGLTDEIAKLTPQEA